MEPRAETEGEAVAVVWSRIDTDSRAPNLENGLCNEASWRRPERFVTEIREMAHVW